MLYWYSIVASRYYVIDAYNIVHGYASSLALKNDYPEASFCPCVEETPI